MKTKWKCDSTALWKAQLEHWAMKHGYVLGDAILAPLFLQLPCIAWFHEGNFTICVLHWGARCVAAGVAKRNPVDKRNPRVAHELSLYRAIGCFARDLNIPDEAPPF